MSRQTVKSLGVVGTDSGQKWPILPLRQRSGPVTPKAKGLMMKPVLTRTLSEKDADTLCSMDTGGDKHGERY